MIQDAPSAKNMPMPGPFPDYNAGDTVFVVALGSYSTGIDATFAAYTFLAFGVADQFYIPNLDLMVRPSHGAAYLAGFQGPYGAARPAYALLDTHLLVMPTIPILDYRPGPLRYFTADVLISILDAAYPRNAAGSINYVHGLDPP